MPSVEIRKVTNKKELDNFIQFHYDLYRGNEYDAPNLYRDELHTLSKNKNSAFEFCEAEYFLAYKDGKVVGRIAGIINHRANEAWETNSVRFGWIDFQLVLYKLTGKPFYNLYIVFICLLYLVIF